MTATSDTSASGVGSLADLEANVQPVSMIPVPISYDIIRLFSEGLYQSPQKAIEELVSNSYDAGASVVRILMPPSLPTDEDRLWVIDDGEGLDEGGFANLWRIAESRKAKLEKDESRRAPIGQFGIGKLASYVLAWRLTHVSRDGDIVRVTSMDFRQIEGVRQNDKDASPYELGLRELSLAQAKELMADVEHRDPQAWNMLFGTDAPKHWTAAGLSEFKDLYSKLGIGRLRWVLRTAMPLVSDFTIFVDGDKLETSKIDADTLLQIQIGGSKDDVELQSGLSRGTDDEGPYLLVQGIDGPIRGSATLYKNRLTDGKSDRWNRSNGYFVRVRGRIINIDDELFGAPALNHATWSRFSMEIVADGLRNHLLSSREGVRESDAIDSLRNYLIAVFNRCRSAYDAWVDEQDSSTDVSILLRDAPSAFVVEPLIEAVTRAIDRDTESYYVARVPDVDETDRATWLANYAGQAATQPITDISWQKSGVNDRAVRYRADSRKLIVNEEHPFIAKLLASEKRTRSSATLFASSELLVDVLLQDYGLQSGLIFDLLSDRDRVLRLVAGQEPTTAAEVLRLLKSATSHETALERAVGLAFRALGFEYERRGGNAGGADGVLDGRLGRGSESIEDFRLVYDAKQTKSPSVPADKIDPNSLRTFLSDERADYAFFVAIKYDAEDLADGKVNKKVALSANTGQPVTLLKVSHLQDLVELHYRYGLTLTRLRNLFETAHTVLEVDSWIAGLSNELQNLEPRVPLNRLLSAIEAAKADVLATPTIASVRVGDADLRAFTVSKLTASLRSVVEIVSPRFIELDESSGEVRLHTTASQVVAEVDRSLQDLFGGITASDWPSETP